MGKVDMSCERSIRAGALAAALSVGGTAPTSAHKPVAPIEIRLVRIVNQRRDPFQLKRMRVEVTPRVDAPRLEVEVTLPAGVVLVRGELRWSCVARARQEESRDLVLKAPTQGERQLVATARLVAPRALPRSRTASYTFNARVVPGRAEGPLSMPVPKPRPGRASRRTE